MAQPPRTEQDRRAGLDLLRILSMVMIIGLHMLGQGGILDASAPGSAAWYVSRGLQCLFYCAVDCYGLLSGYVGSGRRGPGPRLLLLWLTVVLYSLLFALYFHWRSPQLVGKEAFLNAVFPVLTRQYWYFTAYFGLALTIPMMEEGLGRLGGRRAVRCFLALLVFFCLLPTLLHSDAFHLRGGYAMLWLVLLYLMGAALREGGLFRRLGIVPLLLIGVICLSLTFATVLCPMTIPGLSSFTLLSYTSPTVTVDAACLLLLFGRIRGKGGRAAHAVTALSRTSFGVYILHTNPLLWWLSFPQGCLAHWAARPAWVLALAVPLAAVGVYLACAAADGLRILAFRALRLRERFERTFARLFPEKDRPLPAAKD